MHLRFASLVICTAAATLMACSSPAEPSTTVDTGRENDTSTEEDTSRSEDTGSAEDSRATDSTVTGDSVATETSASDTSLDTKEVATTCFSPGATETEDCGKCGTRARLCDTDKKWLPWGLCTGETGACTPGESRSVACGKCGTRMETCSAMCAWDPMACTGEGLCNAGDVEIQYGSCSTPGYVKTRTCSSTTCAWGELSGCVQPKGWIDIAAAPIPGRYGHTAVWAGGEMIVWGGYGSGYLADGAAYNPTTNAWRTLPSSGLVGRRYHAAVAAGSKMIVWGGYNGSNRGDGAVYDTSSMSWSAMSTTGAPTARYYHSAVWSGSEMIVWGGYASTYVADGYAYNPSTNTWRTINPAPLTARYGHGAEFVNGKMVVFGGYSGSYLADAAAYDPAANTWTTLTPPSADLDGRYFVMAAVDPTKKQVAFFGGTGSSVSSSSYKGTGALFDAVAGSWKSITLAPESVLQYPRRQQAMTWLAPDGFYVWGGNSVSATSSTGNYNANNGAVFDTTTSTWRSMSSANAPAGRYSGTAVWTGAEAIIWGGYTSSTYVNDGKIYRP